MVGGACHDELSGLKNRYSLLRDFDKLQGEDICLAIMDIDYFKRFNDTYGHVAGDRGHPAPLF